MHPRRIDRNRAGSYPATCCRGKNAASPVAALRSNLGRPHNVDQTLCSSSQALIQRNQPAIQ